MTTIAGLPAHALLVHAIVVLAPLTAALEILCAIWPAARRRLVWLVLAFAAVTLVLTLKAKGVQPLSGVNYERIDDDGLHISFGSDRSDPRLLEVDNVVICAGQDSVRDLEDGLRRRGINPHVIGGAALAAELDAKRAIRQGTELAAKL